MDADKTMNVAAEKALSVEAFAVEETLLSTERAVAEVSKLPAVAGEVPGSAVLEMAPVIAVMPDPATAPKVEGYIDGLDSRWNVVGWALSLRSTDERLKVELIEEGRAISGDMAMRFRGDLLDAQRGDGKHGFQISIPSGLFDGQRHNLAVLVALPDEQIVLGQLNIILPSRLPKFAGSQDSGSKMTTAKLVESILEGSRPPLAQNLDTYVQTLTQVLWNLAQEYDLATALGLLYIHILRRRIDEGGLQTRLTRVSEHPEQLGAVVREVVQSHEAQSRLKRGGVYHLPDLEAMRAWTRLRPII